MFIHKTHLIILFSLLFVGCATTYAPSDWLPETEEVPKNTFGGWLTLTTYSNISEGKWLQYGGEFISQDSDYVYVLYDTIYVIPKNSIQEAILELDQKNSNSYALWTTFGTLSTILNGFYLVFTAPFWLVTGVPATVSESNRDIYSAENPDLLYWIEVQKFARFPQGLPKDIDLKNIEPKKIIN